MKLINWIILFFIFLPLCLSAQESWSFVSAPDWHTGDRELRHPAKPYSQADVALQLRTINDMKACAPEVFLISGDLCGGPWVGDAWRSIYGMGGTQADAIINVADIIYGNLKYRFTANGLDRILVAIGDHEIGEDRNWKPGNEVSNLLPVYRDGFQRIWNRDKQGKFIYSEKIGSADSRPLGTPWENTSYAYKYKNVLFLTIDIFHQPDPLKAIGYAGKSIYADMPKVHLDWFESVLKEAQNDPQIKHIIVQAHTPVLEPVRGRRSSMLYAEYRGESTFWKAMERYNVDLYFAGEVHTPSAQRSQKGLPIQVVHGDYAGANYIQGRVFDDRLILTLRETDGTNFSTIGEILIDKSGEKIEVIDSGLLEFLNTDDVLVHYTFDEIKLGEVSNVAQMAKYYNLNTEYSLVKGIKGMALKMDGNEIAECPGYGIMTDNHPITFLAWLKTTQKGMSYIASNGWTAKFNVVMKDGHLAVYVGGNSCLIAEDIIINDGTWHQLGVVFPEGGETLKDVLLYVDGHEINKQLIGEDARIWVSPQYRMRLGGSNIHTEKKFEELQVQNFIGKMDEVSFWYRGLSSKEVQNEYGKINIEKK